MVKAIVDEMIKAVTANFLSKLNKQRNKETKAIISADLEKV